GELRPLTPPLERGRPVLHMPFPIRDRHTPAPLGARQPARPAGTGQPVTQIVQLGLRNVDAERLDVSHVGHAAKLGAIAERQLPRRNVNDWKRCLPVPTTWKSTISKDARA